VDTTATGLKHCTGPTHPKGGTDLPLESFAKNRTRKDGLQDFCQSCDRIAYSRNHPKTRTRNRAKWITTSPYDGSEKTCSRCRAIYSRVDDGTWRLNPTKTDGLDSRCHECRQTDTLIKTGETADAAKALLETLQDLDREAVRKIIAGEDASNEVELVRELLDDLDLRTMQQYEMTISGPDLAVYFATDDFADLTPYLLPERTDDEKADDVC
jgi:hypothetical protein